MDANTPIVLAAPKYPDRDLAVEHFNRVWRSWRRPNRSKAQPASSGMIGAPQWPTPDDGAAGRLRPEMAARAAHAARLQGPWLPHDLVTGLVFTGLSPSSHRGARLGGRVRRLHAPRVVRSESP